mmetsp:Transcript_34612/g.66128  ORF Transcript_34612/g.66128 Transcript_34612/m.66128 type:complete len:102 (-) Transcript_34612:516-821(-)
MGKSNALIECCCSPACSLFCSMISIFGMLTMVSLGLLIGSGYEYVGAWVTEEALKADSASQAAAAKNCYTGAVIWTVFLGLSCVCCFANRSKTGGSPTVRY